MADLRARWRRSLLGIAWSLIQPLGMTLLLAFVFSRLFKQDVWSYAPYIFSGMIVWEFFVSTLTGGSLAFVQADAYIKQQRYPLAIYTLRTVLANMTVLILASIPLVGWALIARPQSVGWPLISIVLAFPLLALVAWPAATCLAYIATRFRDLPHAMGLILQAMWFVSPIYFDVSFFRRGGLDAFVDANPIYHALELFRAPLLRGEWPTLANFGVVALAALALTILAGILGRRAEPKVIFYL